MHPPIERKILLNPGPATTTDTVKMAQVVPDICPRVDEFVEVVASVRRGLARIVADERDYATVLLGGSGTAAVEAMVAGALADKALLVINNGAYGLRIRQIAEVYGIPFVEFVSPDNAPIDLERLDAVLAENAGRLSHLAVVHHETTTGLLNDIAAVGELARRHGLEMLVDAMSSFAAIPIDMRAMNIAYLASSSNKNIQGMAGIAFVIARRSVLDGLSDRPKRSYYLDLFAQYQALEKTGQMRFTPPVQTIYALRQAIEEQALEGTAARYARYTKSWKTVLDAFARLGIRLYVEPAWQSRLLVTAHAPDGLLFDHFQGAMYQAGFTVYPGKTTKENTFRVACIGEIDYRDIEAFIARMESYLVSGA